jgi:hypothetical protein
MPGISVNKKTWLWSVLAVILVIAGITILMLNREREIPPSPTVPPIVKDNTQHGTDGPPLPAEVAEPKPMAGTTPPSPPPLDEYSYPVELEGAFIQEAMETIPRLIEVEVHEPGVVFFRHEPDQPEYLEMAMEDLAELYKTRLVYDKPVNVVFFISGRPVKSKVFFRE